MRIFRLTLSFFYFTALSFSQDAPPEIKTIDEVIQGIDDLLSGVDAANEPQKYTDPSKTLLLPGKETLDRPFRLENELMPGNLQVQDEDLWSTQIPYNLLNLIKLISIEPHPYLLPLRNLLSRRGKP